MKQWSRWALLAGSIVVLAGSLVVIRTHQTADRYEQGPYAHALDRRWDLSGDHVLAHTPVFLGGAPILNPEHTALKVLSVKPTNLPRGLQLLWGSGFKVPQEIGMGPLSWAQKLPHHTFQRTPTRATRTDMEPALIVKAAQPGQYVIRGLLVTYQLGSAHYTDYARTEFVVCAYGAMQAVRRASSQLSGCGAHIPPPPKTWP